MEIAKNSLGVGQRRPYDQDSEVLDDAQVDEDVGYEEKTSRFTCPNHPLNDDESCSICKNIQVATEHFEKTKKRLSKVDKLEQEFAKKKQKLAEEKQRLSEQIQECEEEIQKVKEEIQKDDSKKTQLELVKSRGGMRHIISSPSTAAKDRTKRYAFRKLLPNHCYDGAFVVHPFYTAFVKAARRMLVEEVRDDSTIRSVWPSEDDWKKATEIVSGYINTETFFGSHSFFSEEMADLKSTLSSLAVELLRHAINCLRSGSSENEDDEIVVTHRIQCRNPKGNLIEICSEEEKGESNKDRNVDFNLDILVWTRKKNYTAIAAIRCGKTPQYEYEARELEAQSDMCGLNFMSLKQRLCIPVNICGGKNIATWEIQASAIIDWCLHHSSVTEEQTYARSTLFEGRGADGIVGLAAGLIKAAECLPDRNDFGYLFTPDVGYCEQTNRMIKAYPNSEYFKHNIELVRNFVDATATLCTSRDEKLFLVETTYFESDWWEEAVPLCVFADILQQLYELHENNKVHGDIRIANMLRKPGKKGKETGCLIDFDYVGSEYYPPGMRDIEDGARHPALSGASEKVRLHKDHDVYSMSAVMKMFAALLDTHEIIWHQCIEDTEKGNLESAIRTLSKPENAEVKVEWKIDH